MEGGENEIVADVELVFGLRPHRDGYGVVVADRSKRRWANHRTARSLPPSSFDFAKDQ
jgi:hypothetical protein